MGVSASFHVISQSEYRKFRADPRKYVCKILETFDLYKEWPFLYDAVESMPFPINLTLRGNRPVVEDDSGYFGFATPALVKKIHIKLSRISDAALLAAFKAASKGQGVSISRSMKASCLSAFRTTKAAYKKAAGQAAYLSVVIV